MKEVKLYICEICNTQFKDKLEIICNRYGIFKNKDLIELIKETLGGKLNENNR